MTKRRAKKKSGGDSAVFIIIALGAVIVVLALIVLSGGFAAPTQTVSAASLELCNGAPCPSRGNPASPVTMVELSDYACSHCRDYNLLVEPILEQEYVATGKINYVSHVFSLWPETQEAAAASLCAADQGKYWEFHHEAFANQATGSFPTTDSLLAWGRQIGLNEAAFTDCVRSNRHLQDARVSALEGSRAGVTSTPTFFINDKIIRGNLPVEQFRAELDAALAGR